MAQSNSEALAGIAVAQMIRQGTPIIYGCESTMTDMKTGSPASGCPEHSLCVAYGARLAKAYGLPCRGGGTSTDAKSVSVQSGYESVMNLMATRLDRVNLAFHSAGILDTHAAMSFEQFIVDLEIIGSVDHFMKGIRIDDEALALNVIKEVGPGGEYLTHAHTMKYCREEPYIPKISLRGKIENVKPDELLMNNLKAIKEQMLSAYKKPELPCEVRSRLKAYLKDHGIVDNLPE